MQHYIGVAGPRDPNMIGQMEPPFKRPCGNTPMEVFLILTFVGFFWP